MIKPYNTYYSDQWALNNTGQFSGINGFDINISGIASFAKGTNIKVAVIDEGVDLTHPDLAANLLAGHDAINNASGGSNGAPAGNDAHGTACAGIIGALDNNKGIKGVAPNCKIIPIKVGFTNQYGYWETDDDILRAGIRYAWETAGADILSNSWGGGLPNAALTAEINNAVTQGRNRKGCVVVFAAGNNNNSSVNYPASLSTVIGVGAMSPCGERKSPTSCDTETLWGSCYGSGLDVVAPGVLIPTLDIQGQDGYNPNVPIHPDRRGRRVSGDYVDRDYTIWFTGTSAACPHVAGIAALVLSVNPNLTGQSVRYIIESTCRKLGNYSYNVTKSSGSWNNETGYGLVNASAAVNEALSRYSIVGSGITSPLCLNHQTVYSISGLPNYIPVTWECGYRLAPIGNSTGNSLSFAYTGVGGPGASYIRAKVGNSLIAYREIWCGVPQISSVTSDGQKLTVETSGIDAGITRTQWTINGYSYTSYSKYLYYSDIFMSNAGSYLATVTAYNGCGGSSSYSFYVSLGKSGYSSYTIAPNPGQDFIYLSQNNQLEYAKTSKDPVNLTIKISSMTTGIVMKELVISDISEKLDVSNLSNGVYVLSIYENDILLESLKMIIKR